MTPRRDSAPIRRCWSRSRHRMRGWVSPGGKVEPGETPRMAAARELMEEAELLDHQLPANRRGSRQCRSLHAGSSPTAVTARN
ncbi:NUDIX domain-containing protein [Actinophytocola sp.]|uniref:NUDIX domain-containing protein n=1 Tax=Actinophytocola sp. TaxID=1872138 RepID=UPI002D7F3381|nr:NUDIX domain-containing protein [Actinophytocola sp.]HET9142967.1 NUDIX domain-containing protein [Actinophytocola sp.]